MMLTSEMFTFTRLPVMCSTDTVRLPSRTQPPAGSSVAPERETSLGMLNAARARAPPVESHRPPAVSGAAWGAQKSATEREMVRVWFSSTRSPPASDTVPHLGSPSAVRRVSGAPLSRSVRTRHLNRPTEVPSKAPKSTR